MLRIFDAELEKISLLLYGSVRAKRKWDAWEQMYVCTPLFTAHLRYFVYVSKKGPNTLTHNIGYVFLNKKQCCLLCFR